MFGQRKSDVSEAVVVIAAGSASFAVVAA